MFIVDCLYTAAKKSRFTIDSREMLSAVQWLNRVLDRGIHPSPQITPVVPELYLLEAAICKICRELLIATLTISATIQQSAKHKNLMNYQCT